MGQHRRVTRALVAAIAAATILSACGGGAKPAPAPAPSSSPTPAPAPSAPAFKTNTPKDVLVMTMASDVDNLDPQGYRSPAAYTVDFNMYSIPVNFASKKRDDGAIVVDTENLAGTLADLTISKDLREYTWKIKPGFKFTNGSPVNAAAMKFSMERALLGPTYTRLVYTLIGFKSVDEIKVVDDMTLTVTLEKGTAMAPKIFALGVNAILDPKATQEKATDQDKWAAGWYKTNVVGTGPYALDKWTPGVEMVLKPAAGWEDKVPNKGVVLKIVPSAEERYALLKKGDVDIAEGIPLKEMESLKADPNLKVWDFPSRAFYYLAMDNTKPPFNNKLVRQAVAYAVPYQTIIDKVLYGYARQAKSPLAIEMPGYDAGFWNYNTNIEKAKQLMQQAGLGNGFKTQIYTSLSRTEDQQVAVWVQANLKQIGIDVEIQKLSEAEYRDKWKKRELPMFFDNWLSWVNDPVYQLNFLFTSPNQGTNPGGYANPAFDKIVGDAFYEIDQAKFNSLIKDAQKILMDDLPVVPLYQRNDVFVTQKNVEGMNYWADRYLRFWMMSKK